MVGTELRTCFKEASAIYRFSPQTESILEISDGFRESDKEDQDYLKYCKPSLLSMHYPWRSLTRLVISDWSSTLIQLPILSLLTIPQAYPLSTFLNYTTVLYYTLILNFQCIYSHFVIQHLQSMIVLRARVLPSQTALFESWTGAERHRKTQKGPCQDYSVILWKCFPSIWHWISSEGHVDGKNGIRYLDHTYK